MKTYAAIRDSSLAHVSLCLRRFTSRRKLGRVQTEFIYFNPYTSFPSLHQTSTFKIANVPSRLYRRDTVTVQSGGQEQNVTKRRVGCKPNRTSKDFRYRMPSTRRWKPYGLAIHDNARLARQARTRTARLWDRSDIVSRG